METALQFSHVTLGYENIVTTSDLNLTISKGDYLCIIGENGSGKSTFVKSMLGLLRPLKGEIQLTGNWKRSDIGYLPQQTPAQRDFPASVREIVRSGFLNQMRHRPFFNAAEKAAAQQAMEKLGIASLQKRCYRELSGGQQQRVLLARALCAAQKLLILDEPTTGLDPVAAEELYQVLQALNRTEQITIVMVTHDVQRAVYYAKHLLHLGQKTYTYDTAAAYRSRQTS
ncbi:MAG: ATP-binding cassette domain-containing protein [Oscillospiraceae bacterium]|nr:ATP-binding cassette domain-containing protein [Oscillospiraceae bacterium]